MNFCSVPYEADYGMYADSKMKSVPQYAMNMNPGQGQGQPMQPLNPPQMNLQMQLPTGISQMSSYPMQGMPLNMMSGGGSAGMTPMSTMSTNLPIGAMAPLNSMTMMPMMGNSMGGIDAPGLNAVLPDLQSMSTMGQMQPLQQYGQSGDTTQMQQGRLSGGAISPTGNWNSNPGQMMANNSGSGGMWQYSQPMQQQQYQQAPQYQQQHQQQAQQQGNRMKSAYDVAPSSMHYRDVRNGLNSPSMQDTPKYIKGNNSFNCGKSVNKVPHWR